MSTNPEPHVVKIVYYGPDERALHRNLAHIARRTDASIVSRPLEVAGGASEDAKLWTMLGPSTSTLRLRAQPHHDELLLATAPPEPASRRHRRLALDGASGVVFVATPDRWLVNRTWLEELSGELAAKYAGSEIPILIQLADPGVTSLPGPVMTANEVKGAPCVEADLGSGIGVMETIQLIAAAVKLRP